MVTMMHVQIKRFSAAKICRSAFFLLAYVPFLMQALLDSARSQETIEVVSLLVQYCSTDQISLPDTRPGLHYSGTDSVVT